MPIYEYKCNNENCDNHFEVFRGMTEDFLIHCEECNEDSLGMVYHVPGVFVRGEPKTLIQQADYNSRKIGVNAMEERWAKEKEQKKVVRDAAKKELVAKINNKLNMTQRDVANSGIVEDMTVETRKKINSMDEKQIEKFIKGD